MNPLRSVGARLSLALAVVVAGALAVVWIALVPSLEHCERAAEIVSRSRAAPR
jgi:hypothetical protein